MKTLRRILLLVLTTLLVAGLLALSFHLAKAGDTGEGALSEKIVTAFRNARLEFAPLALLMGMLVFPIKAVRWRILLAREKGVKSWSLLSAIMIGFMVNCILMRLGELARPLVLGIKGETRTATAFASIALERIFDLCTVALFLVIALLWVNPQASGAATEHLATLRKAAAIWLGVAVGGGVTFLFLLRRRPEPTTRFALKCVSWLPKRFRERVEGFLKLFLTGMNTLEGPRQVALLAALSLVHWLSQVLFFLFAGYCFPELGLTFSGALLVFAATAVAVAAVPLPGYLGIYQNSILAATAILALPSAVSLSFALLSWALNVPVIIIVGFIFLWSEGLTLGQLRSGSLSQTEPPPPS